MKNLEIENKYLLSYNKACKFLETLDTKHSKKIVQCYIKYSKNSIKRVRKIGKKYIYTLKKGSGRVRQEREKNISKKKYKRLSKRKIGNKIIKTRYFFTIDKKNYELDIFKKRFKGLAFLEIEFKNKKQMQDFILPEILSKIVIRDVSEDNNYTNSSLALLSNIPFENQEIFESIDLFDNNKNFVFSEKKSIYDYLQNWLYCYFVLLKKYAQLTVQNNNSEDLHQFRINIRRIRSLLAIYKELFDKDTVLKIMNSLKIIVSQTNKKRDIDVFLSKLDGINDSKILKFIEYLKDESQKEKRKIKKILESQEFLNILFDFEVFIKEDYKFFAINISDLPVKKYSKKKFKKLFKKIIFLFKKINHNSTIEELHKIRIKIKKFKYFLEISNNLLKKYRAEKIRKSFKKYQNLFGHLNDIQNQIKIVQDYCSIKNISTLEMNLASLQKELQETREKISDLAHFFLEKSYCCTPI